MRVVYLVIALAWITLVLYAQATCSIVPSFDRQCYGPDIDVWMLPFFSAIFGIPAVIASIRTVINFRQRGE